MTSLSPWDQMKLRAHRSFFLEYAMKCERDAWIWLGIAAVCFACSYGLPLWAFIMEILLGIGNAAFACYSWWQAYGARRDAADCDRLLDGSYG